MWNLHSSGAVEKTEIKSVSKIYIMTDNGKPWRKVRQRREKKKIQSGAVEIYNGEHRRNLGIERMIFEQRSRESKRIRHVYKS